MNETQVKFQESRFYKASDVSEILGVSQSKAYAIIKTLNDDLQEKGFITVSGKISKRHFEEKVYL